MPSILAIILGAMPILWNVGIVLLFVRQARKGTLTALKFSIIFVLSLGLTVALPILILATRRYGLNLATIGIPILVLLIHLVISHRLFRRENHRSTP